MTSDIIENGNSAVHMFTGGISTSIHTQTHGASEEKTDDETMTVPEEIGKEEKP